MGFSILAIEKNKSVLRGKSVLSYFRSVIGMPCVDISSLLQYRAKTHFQYISVSV